jgi:hypothetical protein
LEGIVVNDQTGRLVDFFDKDALAEQVSNLLADKNLRAKLMLGKMKLFKLPY